MGEQGEAYAAFIEAELGVEEARRTEVNGRSLRTIAASGTQYGLAVAAFAFLRGKDFTPSSWAASLYVVAIVIYLSAVICALVAAKSYKARAAESTALKTMIGEHWTDDHVDALNYVAYTRIKSIDAIRRSNKAKTTWLGSSMALQVVAIVLLTAAVILTAM